MIDVRNLEKSFGDHKVLDGINEHIYPGEKVVVIGPSGSGKINLFTLPESVRGADSGNHYRRWCGYHRSKDRYR